jgi:hypothetical protein
MFFLDKDMTEDDIIDVIGSWSIIVLGAAVSLYVITKEITK